MIRPVAALFACLVAIAPAAAQMPGQDNLMGRAAPGGEHLAAGLLRNVAAFSALTDAEISALGQRAEPHLFRGGEAVVREGDTTDSMFVLGAGTFAVFVKGTRVATLNPGEVMGEYSLLTGASRTATVRALQDGVVFEFPRADMAPVLRAHPEVVAALAATMADRLQANDPQGRARDQIAKEIEAAARARLGL
jgi:CRP-like cAMP-binding protein